MKHSEWKKMCIKEEVSIFDSENGNASHSERDIIKSISVKLDNLGELLGEHSTAIAVNKNSIKWLSIIFTLIGAMIGLVTFFK